MVVTKIELIKKEYYRVDLEYTFAFALYKSEIRQYGLKEGMELSTQLIQVIQQDIVIPRARKKAMMLLQYRDRTKEELRSRLLEAQFHQDVVEDAISYVESYGYINDERYIEQYISFQKEKKSKKQLQMELLKKGIAKQEIANYMEENEWDEFDDLRTLVQKRCFGKSLNEEKELQKQYAYFMRKGYQYSDIKRAIQQYMLECTQE